MRVLFRFSVASGYESATCRRYYRGRTETCRSCTAEVAAFVRAMGESGVPTDVRYTLLSAAAASHRGLMNQCEQAQGVDRHLLGLQMIARDEFGMDPNSLEVFKDPAWKKRYGMVRHFVLVGD